MRVAVVLLAAGAGRRMKAPTPKGFLRLAGRPLYEHSLETFRRIPGVIQVVLVVPPDRVRSGWVPGGARRQDSVLNGLKATDPRAEVVLIHDAARPFITADVIRGVIRAAAKWGGAVAAVPTRDTLKRVGKGGRIVETPDRSAYWSAQTPQGFRRATILGAYAAGHGRKDATDDAQIVERAGKKVVVVAGLPGNFKITSREDLQYAEYVIKQ